MDFVSGKSSSKYLKEQPVTKAGLLRLLALTVDALTYLHANETAHLDLKPDNILVTNDGVPVIADLGTAKKMGGGLETTVAVTYDYVHPEFAGILATDPSDPNRVKGPLQPSRIKPAWDLYSLGKTILNWIGYGTKGDTLERRIALEAYDRKYLLLLAARLLDGEVPGWLQDRVGLDHRLLKELKYVAAADALVDVRKLSGEYSLVDALPELNAYHPNTLQVAADGPTTYSDRLKQLIHYPLVRRLSAITQLGVVNQVYPTATHSRLKHSIGTYHNACRFVLSLYSDPLSPLFKQVITERDIRTLLVSAVLHDVGQYPLAHDLEEINDVAFDHRMLGFDALLKHAAAACGQEQIDRGEDSLQSILESWQVSIDDVVAHLQAHLEEKDLPFKTRLLHSIIDGPLDADKLDYLKRDSDRLKVPYALGIDEDRILRSLTTIVKKEGDRVVTCIGVHEKARVAAEFVAVARYALFSQAYWQHTVRCMKAMLSRATWRLIVARNDGSESWQKTWIDDFREFVMDLPGAVYDAPGAGAAERTSQSKEHEAEELALHQSSLTAMDAAVVRYLWRLLNRLRAPEAELLVDLTRRHLYKRLFVFSEERHEGWHDIVEKWEKLTPDQKLNVLRSVEENVGRMVAHKSDGGADSISKVTLDASKNVSLRVAANRPLLLIDVPGPRPGASLPLYYVVEGQRRALRKDERAVGEVEPSAVWQRFGNELRNRAGKVRVFCAPEIVDVLEATVKRKDFVDAFNQEARQYVKS